jgi:hypothetical protein
VTLEEFTVQPSSGPGIIILLVMVAAGAFLVALAFFTGRRAKTIRATFIALIVLGAATVGVGVWLFLDFTAPSTTAVGPGYVSVQSPSLSGTGNFDVTSDQISAAYVGQIGSGNLTLVVSSNSTDLVVVLKDGEYVILGVSNTQDLVASFSENVFPVA